MQISNRKLQQFTHFRIRRGKLGIEESINEDRMTDRGTNKDRASSCQRKCSQVLELPIQKIKGRNWSRQLIKLKKKKRRIFEIKVRIHSILQNNLKTRILHERNKVFQCPQKFNIINGTKNSNRSFRMASQRPRAALIQTWIVATVRQEPSLGKRHTELKDLDDNVPSGSADSA